MGKEPGARFSKAPETFRVLVNLYQERGVYAWNFLYEEKLCSHWKHVNKTAL